MHIPDGFLNFTACLVFFIIAGFFLLWAWRGARKTLPRSFVPLIAIMSAVVFVVQFFAFPVVGGGSTWHIMGGTIMAMILGPHGTIISETITLIIQASFGDGGISTFGANIINMAVISAGSFYIVKVFLGKKISRKRLAASLFAAAWISNTLTALSVGLQIGLFPGVGTLGGVAVTVPSMLFWYVPTGIIEATVTTSLILTLTRIKPVKMFGLRLLTHKANKNNDPI
jgi:cobalt/nickel transport system permease protein